MSKRLQDLFGKVTKQIANSGLVANDYNKTTEHLLRFAAENGMTLEECSNPLFMDRSIRTLKKQVRRIGNLTFPDYTPRKLKPKKEKKRRAKKA